MLSTPGSEDLSIQHDDNSDGNVTASDAGRWFAINLARAHLGQNHAPSNKCQ